MDIQDRESSEGRQRDWRSGIQGQNERPEVIQLTEEKIQGEGYQYWKGRYRDEGYGLFSVVSSDRTRGNRQKLKYRTFCFDARKKKKKKTHIHVYIA